MDFINRWPYDVVDLVFQHISGSQILSLMTVSTSWNEHLSRSNALKRVVLNPSFNKPGIECLLNSQRKYRHLKVVNGTKVSREIVEIISNPMHEFISIIIFRTQLTERKQIEQIFLNTSLTLQRLELQYITYEKEKLESDDLLTSYHFPSLKSLRIEYHSDSLPWFNKFIASFPQLEAITLGNASDEHLKNLILEAIHLKKLTISGRFYDDHFYRDLSTNFKGKLKEFVFNDILSSSQENVNLSYFNNFFISQSESLCRFETDALLEPDELETAFRMKNLTELFIKGFHYNQGLMDVYLENMRSRELPTAAALRTFSVHYMNQHLLELMAINARNLTELKVAQFDPVDVSNPNWFPKLEVLKIFFIDGEIKERVQNKPENERSHFEKLIMGAISNLNNSIQPLMLLTVQHL